MPKALVMAGGTGGHVYPALATAQALIAKGWSVSWVGTRDKIEARVVPEAGIEIDFLDVSGVRGKGVKGLLLAPFKMTRALIQARSVVSKRQPDLVVGFGGFVSVPGGVAAKLKNTPLVIQEQNAVAGSANKLLAKFAHSVATGFSNVLPKAVHTGNPVRDSIAAIATTPSEKARLNLLVVGGSLGAQILNQSIPKVAAQLGCNIWHQTGAAQLDATTQAYEAAGFNDARVTAFIDDMDQAYQWADAIVCRAGALTVSEVAVVGLPAIFVPLPHAIDDHQTANAKWLADQEGAILLRQSALNDTTLVAAVEQLKPIETRETMYQVLQAAAKPDATQSIVELCEQAVNHG